MLDADGRSAAVQSAADVQQTAEIAADEPLGAAGLDRRHFPFEHAGGDVGVLHRKETPEAAALFLLVDRSLCHARDAVQHLRGLIADAEASQQMARRMKRDRRLERTADAGGCDLGEELTELAAARGDASRDGQRLRLVLE